MRRLRNIFLSWMVTRLNGGVVVTFEFEGNKGRKQVHSSAFLQYRPLKQKFVVNWDTKEVTLKGK